MRKYQTNPTRGTFTCLSKRAFGPQIHAFMLGVSTREESFFKVNVYLNGTSPLAGWFPFTTCRVGAFLLLRSLAPVPFVSLFHFNHFSG